MKQHLQQKFKAAGLEVTVDQWVLLHELDKLDGQNQWQLAELTHKDQPTVTRILDLMTRKNWVTRMVDPADRRRYLIRLTTVGKQLISAALPVVQAYRSEGWQGLDDDDFAHLLRILDRIFVNFGERDQT